MQKHLSSLFTLFVGFILITSCIGSKSNKNIKIIPVNTEHFIKENLLDSITEQKIEIWGKKTKCLVIKSNSQAYEHSMGPWCPKHQNDNAEKGGIWFENGKVYDVSGHFIANLHEFYKDDKWKMYNENGTINVTSSKQGCLSAAKPNVEPEYHNFCVECLPDYFKHQTTTYYIPSTPIYLGHAIQIPRDGVGLTFNGVKIDPPAPTHAILAAHTIAPLDDHGGHVNPHGGYHYHALTGSTKEIKQIDNHTPMLGYAIDGFGIYAQLDHQNDTNANLDECGGHSDEIRGYHYHAQAPGSNQVVKCLQGVPGYRVITE